MILTHCFQASGQNIQPDSVKTYEDVGVFLLANNTNNYYDQYFGNNKNYIKADWNTFKGPIPLFMQQPLVLWGWLSDYAGSRILLNGFTYTIQKNYAKDMCYLI